MTFPANFITIRKWKVCSSEGCFHIKVQFGHYLTNRQKKLKTPLSAWLMKISATLVIIRLAFLKCKHFIVSIFKLMGIASQCLQSCALCSREYFPSVKTLFLPWNHKSFSFYKAQITLKVNWNCTKLNLFQCSSLTSHHLLNGFSRCRVSALNFKVDQPY